jgi:GAF domain-containing protein
VVNRRLTGEAWRTYTAPLGGALTVQDVAPGFADQSTPAALNTPIMVRGEPIGALKLHDLDPNRAWSANDQALLEAVASEIAVTIDNARLLEQTERRAQREARLSQIAQRLRQATDIDSILQAATEELSLALDTSHAQAQLGQATGAVSSGNDHRDHGQA